MRKHLNVWKARSQADSSGNSGAMRLKGKVIIEKSRGGRFFMEQLLRFGLDLGQMADFPAFLDSKSFDL